MDGVGSGEADGGHLCRGAGDMPGGGPRVPHTELTLSADVRETAGKAGLEPRTLGL